MRSDIYSVGAILYYLLCWRAPGQDAEAYLRRSNKELTDDQVGVVMRALSTDINGRYVSCGAMMEAVQMESG